MSLYYIIVGACYVKSHVALLVLVEHCLGVDV